MLPPLNYRKGTTQNSIVAFLEVAFLVFQFVTKCGFSDEKSTIIKAPLTSSLSGSCLFGVSFRFVTKRQHCHMRV